MTVDVSFQYVPVVAVFDYTSSVCGPIQRRDTSVRDASSMGHFVQRKTFESRDTSVEDISSWHFFIVHCEKEQAV
jgi:hypothetical protein